MHVNCQLSTFNCECSRAYHPLSCMSSVSCDKLGLRCTEPHVEHTTVPFVLSGLSAAAVVGHSESMLV